MREPFLGNVLGRNLSCTHERVRTMEGKIKFEVLFNSVDYY